MKYEFSYLNFLNFDLGHKFGWKWAENWLISGRKKLKKFFVTKSVIILPKFNWKLAENRPILGPKKPAGLSGFEDRASGGLGPPKKRLGRASGLARGPQHHYIKCNGSENTFRNTCAFYA